ncbi:allantoicase [Micromonospora haikouensis]|uniref:allantoicase n=1 Tax=Micromonospora haikouensis TaxID=686309 RepID=UPI00341FEA5B
MNAHPVDLASRALGGSVPWATDEFFAEKERLVQPGPAAAHPEFGPRGKVYDGWETRRRRPRATADDADRVIVRLGASGVVERLVVDTAHFTGNYPPLVSVDATTVDGHPPLADVLAAPWQPLLPPSPAAGDRENSYPLADPRRWTHLRLAIHPDGGVARLRAYGRVLPDPRLLTTTVDLAAVSHGAVVEDCSNRFYSDPTHLLLPGRARSMGEGWETARRRDDGHDWVLVRLGLPGTCEQVVVDTTHFLGNAPDAVEVTGRVAGTDDWVPVLPPTPVQPDQRHRLPVAAGPELSHVRVAIHPDGGFARLRVLGTVSAARRRAALAEWQTTGGTGGPA